MAWKVKFEEKPETQYPPMNYRPEEVKYPLAGCNNITVYVHKVYGCCPITVEGDEIVFYGFTLSPDDSKISSELPMFLTKEGKPMFCFVALRNLYPYIIAMTLSVSAAELGISSAVGGKDEDGYLQCSAWNNPNCEALVIFRLHPEPVEKGALDAYYEYLAKAGHVGVPSYFLERFASDETKEKRKRLIEEWERAGKPKLWEGWRNPPCQPRHTEKS